MMGLVLMTVLLMTLCVSGQDFQNCTDCYTKQCVSVGDAALNLVDRSVSPCNNFYKYACGGWIERQFLTNGRRRIKYTDTEETLGWIRKLLSQEFKHADPFAVKKAKTWFKLCQNPLPYIRYREPWLTILPQDWLWPLGCEQCNVSDFSLEQSLQVATRHGVHPLFKLSAEVNHLGYNEVTKIAKRYLHIGEPTLQMPVEDYNFLSSEDEFVKNYVNMIVATSRRLELPKGLIRDEAATIEDAKQIVDVELKIASQIRWNEDKTTRKSSLGSLNEDYGQLMNWTRYIVYLASDRHISINITLNETIFVKHPRRLKETIDYFLQLPQRTQVNYLIWRWIDTYENVIVKPEDKLNDIILFGASDDFDPAYRDEGCAWFVTQSFPLVVDRLLFAEYLSLDTVQKVDSMLQQMQYEFNALLSHHNYDWLNANAKKIIKEKIDSITASVGYYFEVMDNNFLDSYYSFVRFGVYYIDFVKQISKVKIASFITNFRSIRSFRSMAPAKEQPPQVFSAYLAIEFQTILLSFSSLVYPWFLDEAPLVVNYAGATHTLARELLRSIDSKGMQFYKNGTEGLWMGHAYTTKFRNLLNCMIGDYCRYYLIWCDVHYGRDTALADAVFAVNLALKLAYKAYINYTNTATTKRYNIGYSGFTNDQLFFVRYAQLMCLKETDENAYQVFNNGQIPSEFRVNAPLQNSKDFAYVFNCPCGSPMNPDNKCVVF